MNSLIRQSESKIELGSKLIFEKVIESIEAFYKAYNSKKYLLLYIDPFREATYSKLIDHYNGKDKQINLILESIRHIIDQAIDLNLPSESDIMSFDLSFIEEHNIKVNQVSDDERHESQFAWTKFLDTYPKYFETEIERTIEFNSEVKFLKYLSLYQRSTFSFYWKNDSNRYLKSRWLLRNFRIIIGLYKEAVEKGIIYKASSYHLYPMNNITELYKNDDYCARAVLVEYLSFVVWLNTTKHLNYDIFCGIYNINNLVTSYIGNNLTNIGSYFATNYHRHDKFSTGFEDVMCALEIIRKNSSKEVKRNGVNKKSLSKILTQIKKNYILSRGNQPKSEKVIERIKQIKLKNKKSR